jgi:urate oxidase
MNDAVRPDRFEISYGKRKVPFYRVHGTPLLGVRPIPESPFTGRSNILVAAEVDIEVFGKEFLPAYTVGDNSNVVATDSMKNIILNQALAYDGSTLEGYLAHVGRHFMTTYEHVFDIEMTIRELPFPAALVPDGDGAFDERAVLFDGSARTDATVASLRIQRIDDRPQVTAHACGRVGLKLLKITGSAFTSFVRDAYTTLPERRDRPLFIYLDVFWSYGDVSNLLGDTAIGYVPAEQVRDLCGAVFHEFVSESIQHLVHEIGNRMLARFPQLAEVRFVAQNRTRDPFFISDKDPSVKVYSDPFPAYGEITLRLRRDEAAVSEEGRAAWDR